MHENLCEDSRARQRALQEAARLRINGRRMPQEAGLFQLSGLSDLVIQPEMQTPSLGPA